MTSAPTSVPTLLAPPSGAGSALAPAPERTQVEIVRVGFAAEGAYIIVQFYAPPRMTHAWIQGTVSLIDEASGTVYNEIPVTPVIGPLIGRPAQATQLGYVMLVNAPTPLAPGAKVTVILGDFRQEHLIVQ
jgi:hypothetical protein